MTPEQIPQLISELQKIDLFHDLSNEELTLLLPFLKFESFKAGKWIIQENEIDDRIFAIRSGRVEAYKMDALTNELQLLGILDSGDWFGEMAHLNKKKRSASIKAFHDTEVIVLLIHELSETPECQNILHKITSVLTKKISERLRNSGEVLVETFREKISLSQSSFQISKTMIYMLILFGIYFNVVAIYNNYAGSFREIINVIFMPTSIVLFGLASIQLIRISGYPLSFYGLTLKGGWKLGFEGFLSSLPILGLLALLKWAMITQIPSYRHIPFFSLNLSNQPNLMIETGVYILLAPLQELIVRGFLQSSFRNFFQGPNKVFNAILASNVIFEVLHTANDLFLAIFSFAFGLFWGALYEYQKTIVGVSISHILIGWWGIFALDLVSLVPRLNP